MRCGAGVSLETVMLHCSMRSQLAVIGGSFPASTLSKYAWMRLAAFPVRTWKTDGVSASEDALMESPSR